MTPSERVLHQQSHLTYSMTQCSFNIMGITNSSGVFDVAILQYWYRAIAWHACIVYAYNMNTNILSQGQHTCVYNVIAVYTEC